MMIDGSFAAHAAPDWDQQELAVLAKREQQRLLDPHAAAYSNFLAQKRVAAEVVGFSDVDPSDLHPALFDWQRAIVVWSLLKGCCAVFADCGLGKTLMQLARALYIHQKTGRDILILTPLTVAAQTVREGVRFGIPVTLCRSQADVRPGINVANYERLHLFDAGHFIAVELDESSILKNFVGKVKQALCAAFARTQFRCCWTATPAPNDYLEIGNHSAFLGIMPANEMLMRWFINDASQAGNYRLKEHARADFWRWVVSWAIPIGQPSDLGEQYSDEGYVLPPLEIVTHVVGAVEGEEIDPDAPGISATTMHAIMRESAAARASKVAEIIATEPGETWAIWCNTNYEADALTEAIPALIEVRGSDKIEIKDARLRAFAAGRIKLLVTKPGIAGYGHNWQHCTRMAFVGLSYSFEDFYQVVRRAWRFGQLNPVIAHIVHGHKEGAVKETVERKRQDHIQMHKEMVASMRATGLDVSSAMHRKTLTQSIQIRRVRGLAGTWEMIIGDCCETVRLIPSRSVGLTVTSPPFANLYIYSDHEADMGNCVDQDEFFRHFAFLIAELKRVTIPGRLCVIHCKDLPRYKGRDGAMGLIDFPGAIRAAFESVPGWVFHSRVTIWKDPVTEMQRTKNHGLLYGELCKDSAGSRQGMADYLMVFRRWDGCEDGPFTDPVHSEEGRGLERFDSYIGLESPDPNPLAERNGLSVTFQRDRDGRWPRRNPFPPGTEAYRWWSIGVWQRYASPVWMDIQQTNVLNGKLARESADEKHICPLQLDVIGRSIALWSNPGDLVLDPFMGVGSTGVGALGLGRRALGLELKASYFDHSVTNLRQVEESKKQLDLLFRLGTEAVYVK